MQDDGRAGNLCCKKMIVVFGLRSAEHGCKGERNLEGPNMVVVMLGVERCEGPSITEGTCNEMRYTRKLWRPGYAEYLGHTKRMVLGFECLSLAFRCDCPGVN